MGRMRAARGSMPARILREKLFWVRGWLPKRQSAAGIPGEVRWHPERACGTIAGSRIAGSRHVRKAISRPGMPVMVTPRPFRASTSSARSRGNLLGGNPFYRGDYLRQCTGIQSNNAIFLLGNERRLGPGVVEYRRLIRLLQEPWQLLERTGIAVDDLAFGNSVAALRDPQLHAFDTAFGTIEDDVGKAHLKTEMFGSQDQAPILVC